MKVRQEAGDIEIIHDRCSWRLVSGVRFVVMYVLFLRFQRDSSWLAARTFYNNNNNLLIMNGTLTLTKRQIFILHLWKKEINLFLLLFVYLFLTRGMFL